MAPCYDALHDRLRTGRRDDEETIMAKKKCRTKDGRRVIRAVEEAGGEVTFTRNQHIRVRGPKGIAVLVADYSAPRALKNTIAVLRQAGIDLRDELS
jgi:hypothetical protein